MSDAVGSAKPVIGLLGGPGSGKSFVAAAMADHGAAVIDADALARAALDRPEVRDTLAAWWGPGVVGGDGRVDRAAVAKRVFDDPTELARLESLVHPVVNRRRGELRERYRADPAVRAVVEDCPLLLERGLEGDCDVLVFVDTPDAVRRRRVADARGWTAGDLAAREKHQWPLDTKRGRADYVLDGGGEPPDVQVHARRLLDRILSNRTLSPNV
ncbi:MAG: dephospho-CoA kinase [Planctomycetota bacterium]